MVIKSQKQCVTNVLNEYNVLKIFGLFIIMSKSLGSRPMVGHMTLDHGIGVRIPASQPIQSIP